MLKSFINNPILILYFIPTLLLSLSLHELSHGLAAYAMGDPTAKNQGRLSLNPLAHLDPMGTIMMVIFGFGWAKPVPVNPMYFNNRKLGMAVTSIAGPMSNLILGFLSLIFLCVMNFFSSNMISNYFFNFFYLMVTINVGLAMFNLLPISPLDGSKILYAVLPNHVYFQIMKYEQYFMPVLFFMLFLGVLSGPISFLRDNMITVFAYVVAPFFKISPQNLLNLFGI